MYFDGHAHFKVDNFNLEYNIKKLKEYKEYITKIGITKSVLSIDPYINENYCDIKHPTKIYDYDKNYLKSICQKCGKTTYLGDDYFRKYNEILLEICYEKIFDIFVMLSLSNNTIQNNIDYFISKYNKKVKGLKLYTSFSSYPLDNLKLNNRGLPCIIHCSKYNNQIPSTMLNFINKYDGYVILAHFACLEYDIIKKLKQLDNVYIDVSPAYQLFKQCVISKKKNCLLNTNNINSVNDLYNNLFNVFDTDRIIWGTDFPYSNIEDEIKALNLLKLDDSTLEKISYKNIEKVLNIKRKL